VKNTKTFHKNLDVLSEIKSPSELFTFIEDKVASFFELTHLSIFVLDDSETKYTCIRNITVVNDMPKTLKAANFNLDSPIVTDLLDSRKTVSLKEVKQNRAVALTEERRIFLLFLSKKLGELKAQACVPGFADKKLLVILVLGEKVSKEEFFTEELELFSLLAEKSAEIIHNFNLLKEKIELFIQSIREISNRLEMKDLYTGGHSHRVGEFSVIMGKKLQSVLDKIPYGEIILYYAAEFHDVGKINIPDRILKKRGILSEKEYAKIKEHPIESIKIIKPMEKWFGKIILDAVLYHHENYDGTGYPYGKKGEEINILARIIRVADSFDAMITDRPYRKAMLQHQVLLELKNGRGKQFDPMMLDAFLAAYKEGLFQDIFFSIVKDNIDKDNT